VRSFAHLVRRLAASSPFAGFNIAGLSVVEVTAISSTCSLPPEGYFSVQPL
jgi:hypothetical protein